MSRVSRADLITPANALTTLGIILTIVGAIRLDTIAGFLIVGSGKFLDIADGLVARRTHTSDFGAFFDASADKLTALILLIAAYHFRIAPVAFLLFVFLYHGSIAVMALDAERHGIRTRPSRLGKNTMFLHVGALLLFALAKAVTTGHNLIYACAAIVAITGIIAGVLSFASYVEAYRTRVRPKSKKKQQTP